MATDKLRVYNEALRIVGERKLSGLTEARQPRYLLDDAWDNNSPLHCLEKGQWTFATRTAKLTYDPGIVTDFGLKRVFQKPTDWAATCMICTDEFFTTPLLRYIDEAGKWAADLDSIYVAYVSNHTNYGMNMALWPSAFADFVSADLAVRIASSLTGNKEGEAKAERAYKKNMLNAKSRDVQSQPTKFPPEGGWNRARHGKASGRDGGSRGNLTG